MNNTKIAAIGIVIVLIAVVGFVALNANDKPENDYNPDIPDSDYYPITIETINPTTNEMVDMTFTERPKNIIVCEGGALDLIMTLGLEDLVSQAFVKTGYVVYDLSLSEKLEKIDLKFRADRSMEHFLSLKPDFVIGWSSAFTDKNGGSMDFWKDRNVNSYVVSNGWKENIEEGLKHVENVGKIFNLESEAQKYIDTFNKSIENIEKDTEGLKDNEKPKVLALEVSVKGDTMWGYGTECMTGSLIELAGGISKFKGGSVVELSYEEIVKLAPEMILLVINGDFRDEAFVKAHYDKLYSMEAFASIPAIQNRNVVDYGAYELIWTGIMPVNILDRLYEDFHPEDK